MNKPQTLKPVYWLLFAAGGMISALVLPALMVIFGILLPYRVVGSPDVFYQTLSPWFHNRLFYFLIVGVLFVILWHTAHRFYCVLHDLLLPIGLKTRYALYALVLLCTLLTWLKWW